ncbi:MAG: hypothetical protein HZA54_14985 [Planctomycetes bacterium]|nr:hypothetical protein [Planctomycetota bacterium]
MKRARGGGGRGRRGIMLVEVLAATILLSAVVGLTTAVFWQAWHLHRACLARLGHAEEVAEFARDFTREMRRARTCTTATGAALLLAGPEAELQYQVDAGCLVEQRTVAAGIGTRLCVRGLARAEFSVRARGAGGIEATAVLVFDGAEAGRTAESRVIVTAANRRAE